MINRLLQEQGNALCFAWQVFTSNLCLRAIQRYGRFFKRRDGSAKRPSTQPYLLNF